MSSVDVGAGGDPNSLQARMLQHFIERRVCSDTEILVFGVFSSPSNLMSLVAADGDNIDAREPVEESVDMSLAHTAETGNSDVESPWGHLKVSEG